MTPRQGRRLDLLLVDRGLARSRTEARGLIMAGRVYVDGLLADKPGRLVGATAEVRVEHPPHRYVSRGGAKLEHALRVFSLDVKGLVCLDVGASTGGFTDCLLTHGAHRVYAVDVGYGQLAWKLRRDERVVVLDRTNARYLDREALRRAAEEAGLEVVWPTFATCDLSFISLLKVVPRVVTVLDPGWRMVLLVKPQFEATRHQVGSRGVVRDPAVHVEVLRRVVDGLSGGGVRAAGLTYSPLRGPEGNIEYLLWLEEARPDETGGEGAAGPASDTGGAPGYFPATAAEEVVGEAFVRVGRA
ncbi:MAG TPA: TlyA family rRNA (cytidine-2'-O)-methyltransferase [Clostridiales bacterium]|nr:TlyA family rRNA (cytidine-2'-O)-methyltransferase [Clostridiales bacterium]